MFKLSLVHLLFIDELPRMHTQDAHGIKKGRGTVAPRAQDTSRTKPRRLWLTRYDILLYIIYAVMLIHYVLLRYICLLCI